MNNEIKLYNDNISDNTNEVLMAFKGKSTYEAGVIYCPYKKPGISTRLINFIKKKLGLTKPIKLEELATEIVPNEDSKK